MPNTELPIDLENQVVLMKKYVNFRRRKKMSANVPPLRFLTCGQQQGVS